MKRFITTLALIITINVAWSQLDVAAFGTDYTIDFTGFAGAGFDPDPTAEQLDSDTWSITGLSDGDLEFGDTGTSGDYAKGVTTGFVTSGGVYAADVFGNQGLMVQPTGDDFTPGSFVLRLINTTGSTVGELDVAYTIYALNDQNRANSFNFSYSYDNVSWVDVSDLDYVSPEFGIGLPEFEEKATTLIGLLWEDGQFFYLRWTGDDVSGSGSRDEFALDDIIINAAEGDAVVAGGFSTTFTEIDESAGSLDVNVVLTSDADCSFSVALNPSSSAENDVDFTFADPTILNFFEGGDFIQTINIPITDDLEVEGIESINLDLTVSSGTCILTASEFINISINDNDEPVATEEDIADVTEEDADGVAVSIDELVTITGIVYGGNLRSDGLDFTLIDNTGGIKVFSFSDDFGYTVTEGDEITITGFISQFNGLTQIEPEELEFLSASNLLKVPTEVSALSEETESDLIRLQNCTLNDPAQWLGDGSAYSVDITCDGSAIALRIDDMVNLSSEPAPELPFNLTGLGGQFDPSSPYLDGYQVLPRYVEDIELIEDTPDNIASIDDLGWSIYPNPVVDKLFIQGAANEAYFIQSLDGRVVATGLLANGFIDCSSLVAGNYILVIDSANGKVSTVISKQ